jgi:hypothetical protein
LSLLRAIELTQPIRLSLKLYQLVGVSRGVAIEGNLMLKTIQVTTTTGNEQHILKLFKKYVIDFLKKAVAIAEEKGQPLLPQQNYDWEWVTDSSPAELLERISWVGNSQTRGDGADGN